MKSQLTATVLQQGYLEDEQRYHCFYCGQEYHKQQIVPIEGQLFNARYAITDHLEKRHGGPFKALLALPSEQSGISETQKRLLQLLGLDLTDEEIAEQLAISTSTIRNHRFKLKEKKRQALHFLALMSLLEKKNEKLRSAEINIHNYDERFQIAEEERARVLKNFIDEHGQVAQFPRKEKSKIILLQYLTEGFSGERTYTEKEINQVIQRMFADYVTVRRYLIEYGFLARTHDGEKYWKI